MSRRFCSQDKGRQFTLIAPMNLVLTCSIFSWNVYAGVQARYPWSGVPTPDTTPFVEYPGPPNPCEPRPAVALDDWPKKMSFSVSPLLRLTSSVGLSERFRLARTDVASSWLGCAIHFRVGWPVESSICCSNVGRPITPISFCRAADTK